MNKLRTFQQGISILELMIALTLGSIIILAVTQVYLDSKRSYLFQQGQVGNIESSRFAVLVLDEQLSKAGFRHDPQDNWESVFPASSALSTQCEAFGRGHVVSKSKVNKGFCFRYQPAENQEPICNGTTAALTNAEPFSPSTTNEIVTVAIHFIADDNQLNNGVIQCIASQGGGTAATQNLVGGIADMHVEFGRDAVFQESASWSGTEPIRVIRYGVLSASAPNMREAGVPSAILNEWNKIVTTAAKTRLEGADNRNIYQAASSSQALRNMMP